MLTSGDVVEIDLGFPAGHESGLRRPAIIVTSQRVIDAGSNVVHGVPLTTTIRGFGSEVMIEPDGRNGISSSSAAQCQHIRAVSTDRIEAVVGNVGAVALSHIREVIGLILDVPA
ncbi:MAG: type II toxin-antitoxin system PemK/MazF family toxin [Actinomycetota bacterium]|nr:type II toxin-antitoxin system PemK/MazF family toxin [Actinomycetota bacterium]